ncbi:MAG TPA: hypothetical protein VGC42_11975, partial [Kofleriaceae bacterium]
MIEATCAACGTVNRVADGTLPGGAKFITCAGCKARVAVVAAGAAPGAAAGAAPDAAPDAAIDLADLPAPRRSSALGPAPAAGGKPRSGLAAALDPELPAPRVPRGLSAGPPALELDDLPSGGVPSSLFASDGGVDLPAPKQAAARRPELSKPADVADLPAPKPRAMGDLPAPKLAAKKTLADVGPPAAMARAGLADLPAPKRGPLIPDLPAPPKQAARAADLPAPGGFFDDLPHPGGGELPAPKGFFDDLPAPSAGKSGTDLPAPKGFFDDLPGPTTQQPAAELPAPKGFFDDLPQPASTRGVSDVPAPKGFFDDLPQVKSKPSGVSDV